jgi:hypothetical protein
MDTDGHGFHRLDFCSRLLPSRPLSGERGSQRGEERLKAPFFGSSRISGERQQYFVIGSGSAATNRQVSWLERFQ